MENMKVNPVDLTTLIRTSVGFDRLLRMMDSAMRSETASESYPPYNIEKMDENIYRITMAVAGFSEDDLHITMQDNTLIISGKIRQDQSAVKYLYRGIAGRAFERHFQLADFIKIGEASLDNGLLSILLIREIPEAMKPRKIHIQSKITSKKLIENKTD
ncbi:MAG: Hsp20 family protein [Alphaproteobacteria bacterium]|nr:Hsp20 family protein [Alphaproteobacteria bacterium]